MGGGEETATGSATTEQLLRCLTSAEQHVCGYGNAPTKRGGGDKRQGQGKGSDHRGGYYTIYFVTKVLIDVSIRQPLIESW